MGIVAAKDAGHRPFDEEEFEHAKNLDDTDRCPVSSLGRTRGYGEISHPSGALPVSSIGRPQGWKKFRRYGSVVKVTGLKGPVSNIISPGCATTC